MKNLVQYLKLWQKKRSELKISDDPDADWLGMQSLLDTQLPVTEVPGGGSSKPPRFKLLSMMFIALSAAAMVHFAVKFSKPKATPHHHKHRVHKGHWTKQDSLDALSDSDTVADRPDSIDGPKQTSDLPNANGNKLTLDGKSLPAVNLKVLPGIAGKTDAGDNNTKTEASINEKGTDKTHQQSEAIQHKFLNSPSAGINPADSKLRNFPATDNSNTTVHPVNTLKTDEQNLGNTLNPLVNSGNVQYNNTLVLEEPKQSFIVNNSMFNTIPVTIHRVVRQPLPNKSQKDNKPKNVASSKVNKSSRPSSGSFGFDWGLLIGVNSSGSFTLKSQNSNFYGRLPVDLFAGAYTTFNFNDKWAFNPQVRILSPGVLSGSYKTYTNTLKITIDSSVVPSRRDTTKISHTHTTNDSKKIYSVQLPLYIAYKVTDIISFKAGPVFSFPVKQISTAQIDSANRTMLTNSRFDQKMDIGLSGGISLHYKRLIFEATYLRGLTNHKIVSDSLSYQSRINPSFQFTIGIQLGKKKK